jgi:hypothetical protein
MAITMAVSLIIENVSIVVADTLIVTYSLPHFIVNRIRREPFVQLIQRRQFLGRS